VGTIGTTIGTCKIGTIVGTCIIVGLVADTTYVGATCMAYLEKACVDFTTREKACMDGFLFIFIFNF
jgi:hypothetical protein